MPRYAYSGTDRKGIPAKGEIEAQSPEDARQRLADQGYTDCIITVFERATPTKGKITAPVAVSYTQHHYTRGQVRQINGKQDKMLGPTYDWLETKLAGMSNKSLKSDKMEKLVDEAFQRINKSLKAADLTINFNTLSWFSQPNHYDTYSQDYERATDKTTGKTKFTKADQIERLQDDERVTGGFGGSRLMTTGPLIKQREWQKYGGPAEAKGKAYETPSNPDFNPKTRQVFAALNYARRPSGSNIFYGRSHLVLSDKFKVDALYYPCDTINKAISQAHMLSYDLLATILGMDLPNPKIKDAVFDSCYLGLHGEDTTDALELFEAHLYHEIPISPAAIKKAYIDLSGATKSRQALTENATAWGREFHIPFVFVEAD